MKVTAIALSLGYHDTDYFNEKFKALTSHSPSSYKNQYKGELHAIESLFHKVNDIPLKYKFLLIYLLCVLIPIIAINLFFYQQNSANIRIREEENLRKSIERASGELQSMVEESVAVSHAIAGDQPLYEALDCSYENPVAFYDVTTAF